MEVHFHDGYAEALGSRVHFQLVPERGGVHVAAVLASEKAADSPTELAVTVHVAVLRPDHLGLLGSLT